MVFIFASFSCILEVLALLRLGPIFDTVKSDLRMWKLCVCTSTSIVCVNAPVPVEEIKQKTKIDPSHTVQAARVHFVLKMERVKK